MTLFSSNSETDTLIREIYEGRKAEIIKLSDSGDAEGCMAKVFDVWMFMNRFRNCDLQFYFDEDLHEAISKLNSRRFDVSGLLREKREFRIAYIIGVMVDTGGASIPHRFMLEKNPDANPTFRQYVLDSNISNSSDFETTETYRYLNDELSISGFEHLPPNMAWLEKGKYIEQWLFDNKIDFVVAEPCPATIYALASRPAVITAVLSQDCYSFTLGPGVGDFTFLVTTDQAFKYKLSGENPEKRMKIVMLPLHSSAYVAAAEPMDRAELGVPDNAVVSGSSNMWKTCFGDSEVLLEGIAALIRKHPDYHHVFAGTPRCLDNVEAFVSKNPDVRDNIHFIGPIKNIYRLLKAIDFWVNSFPTSGGSDIECAVVGKPTIELLANRNLNLHGAEFLRSRECDVLSLDEFVALGTRFITDADYRADLGEFLKTKISREFDKQRIIADKIYGTFLHAFEERLGAAPALPGLDVARSISYEKRIGLYNAHGRHHWDAARRWAWLAACRRDYPEKPFAWIKAIEEVIRTDDAGRLDGLVAALDGDLLKDHRIHVMLALGHDLFGHEERALDHAMRAVSLAIYDDIPTRVAARLLVERGRLAEAAVACPAPRGEASQAVDETNVVDILAGLPTDRLPLYYDY